MKKIKLVLLVVAVIGFGLSAFSYHNMKMNVSDWNMVYQRYEDKTKNFTIWAFSDSVANCKAMNIFNEEKIINLYAFAYTFRDHRDHRYQIGFPIPQNFKVSNLMGKETVPLCDKTIETMSDSYKSTLPDSLQKYWDCMNLLKNIKEL